MISRSLILMVATIGLGDLSGCAGGSQRSEWDNLDYSSIARQRGEGDNDSGYTQPLAVGCQGEYICD